MILGKGSGQISGFVINLLTLRCTATIRFTLTLGDEFEEEEIILYLIPATEDLVPDPVPFDHSRAAAFEKRLIGALNDGALCLMTSLGHRVGLFDAMADMPAAGGGLQAADDASLCQGRAAYQRRRGIRGEGIPDPGFQAQSRRRRLHAELQFCP